MGLMGSMGMMKVIIPLLPINPIPVKIKSHFKPQISPMTRIKSQTQHVDDIDKLSRRVEKTGILRQVMPSLRHS